MESLGQEKEQLTTQLNDGSLGYEKLQEITSRLTTVTGLLDEKELRWLELSEYTE